MFTMCLCFKVDVDVELAPYSKLHAFDPIWSLSAPYIVYILCIYCVYIVCIWCMF